MAYSERVQDPVWRRGLRSFDSSQQIIGRLFARLRDGHYVFLGKEVYIGCLFDPAGLNQPADHGRSHSLYVHGFP